jgi:hypothetical protein
MYMDKVYSDTKLDVKKGQFTRPKNLSVSLDCEVYQNAIMVNDSTQYIKPSADSLEEGIL